MELPTLTSEKNRNQEDIMSVLMELEKPNTKAAVPADSSDDEAAARSLLVSGHCQQFECQFFFSS